MFHKLRWNRKLIFSYFYCTRRLCMSLHPVLINAHTVLQFPFCLAKEIQHNFIRFISYNYCQANYSIRKEVETLTCTEGRWETFQSYKVNSLGLKCGEADSTNLGLCNCKTPPLCSELFIHCTIPLKNKQFTSLKLRLQFLIFSFQKGRDFVVKGTLDTYLLV